MLSQWLEQGQRVLDVGTGGGVPGVILAIVRPDLRLFVCESVAKKARAVKAILADLNMPVGVYHERVEQLLQRTGFDVLVARAVARLPKMLSWLRSHWDAFDHLLIIKGRSWEAECREAREQGLLDALEVDRVSTYRTPVTQAENVVLRLARHGSTGQRNQGQIF
jgi:16S rRNA (guanine527-N7)-methyltransferase